MNYREEYFKLIKDIKYKLSKLYLDQKTKKNYEQKLSQIEAMTPVGSDEFTYYEAFLKASKVEASLSKLITSNEKNILPPYENTTYLTRSIKTSKEELKKYRQKLKYLRTNVVSCILTGAIFLSTGAYIISRDSEKPNDKLYLTESKTYYDNVDKTISNSSYQKEKETELIIKKIMPWVAGVKEATRLEYTYKINNMSYDEIINSKDYEKAIANLEFEEKITTMPTLNFSGVFRYDEPIYELTEVRQDKSQYTFQKRFLNRETMLALFGELMIYVLVLSFNHNKPLYESILIGANDIKSIDKIIDAKSDTLGLLKKQYNMTKKKTLKK